MVLGLLSFIVPFLCGYLLVNRCIDKDCFLYSVFLAVPVGFGFISILDFLYILAFGDYKLSFIFVEIFVLLVLLFWNKGKYKIFKNIYIENKFSFAVWALFCILSFAFFFVLSIKHPYGSWDGMRISNMAARFIYEGGKNWQNLFELSTPLARADYPLFLPLNIAKSWQYIGFDMQLVPILYSFVFTFGTFGLLFSSFCRLNNISFALIASLFLVGYAPFIIQGSSQYTDIPLSFFILAVISLVCLGQNNENNHKFFALLGFLAALCGWVKNEGIVFALIFFIAYAIYLKIKKYDLKYFVLGFLSVFSVVLYFKIFLAPANDMQVFLLQNLKANIINKDRYYLLFGHLKDLIFTPIVILLILSSAFLGIDKSLLKSKQIFVSGISIFCLVACYLFIYIVTPHEISWQLNTSFNRLFLHIWPSVIFLTFHMFKQKTCQR